MWFPNYSIWNTKIFVFLISFGYIFEKIVNESSTNENKISSKKETIETCMNDVIIKGGFEKNLNVQTQNPNVETKRGRNEKKETQEVLKINLIE